jgi:hypothetical protein
VDDADAIRWMVMWGKEQEIVIQKRINIFLAHGPPHSPYISRANME